MDFNSLKAMDNTYVANTYARFDLDVVSGKGAVCKDLAGKKYVDFSSGIGVNSLGFCDDEWVKAISGQAAALQHMSNLYYTVPGAELAKTLCERTGMKKVFFANSGAEVNECAIKTARKYSYDKYGAQSGRYEIITLVNSFHGRTVTTLAATGQDVFHKNFDPFTQGFVYADAQDFSDLASKISDKTCAVMVEFIQGEGGVVPLEQNYVDQLAKLCAQKDILLIADEVQTGVGRTGKLYCYEHFGVKPDVVTSAKGIGGGLPFGAVLFGEKTEKTLAFGDHATTFGANPVVSAGAQVVLKRLDEAFLAEVHKKGEYIKEKLLAFDHVTSVTGKGLMIGIEVEGITSREAAAKAMDRGAIVLTAKHKVRLLPPLTITYEEIDRGLAVLKEVIG